MHWSLRVLTGLTDDTEPTIVVQFDNAKYVFNAGEGTYRAFSQRRYSATKSKAIFLSALHPQQFGGFTGLVMALADMGTNDLAVRGPSGLLHYMASSRLYFRRDQLAVSVEECAPNSATDIPIYKDENIAVHSIPLLPTRRSLPLAALSTEGTSLINRKRSVSPSWPDSGHPNKRRSFSHSRSTSLEQEARVSDPLSPDYRPDMLTGEEAKSWCRGTIKFMFRGTGVPYRPDDAIASTCPEDEPAFQGTVDPVMDPAGDPLLPWKLHFRKPLPALPPRSAQALSYVVVGPSFRGKFDAAKAKELGVFGPARGKLIKGEVVTTASGNVVTPEMCVGPPIPPKLLAFIHVPDPSYLDDLFTATTEGKLAPEVYAPEASFHVVIHRLGEGVLEDPRYRAWMKSAFQPDVHHLIASRQHNSNPIVYESTAVIHARASTLDPEIFRTPYHSLEASVPLSSLSDLPQNTKDLVQDTEVHMHPPSSPSRSPTAIDDALTPLLASQCDAAYLNPLAGTYEKAQESVRLVKESVNTEALGKDVVITTLGTGSAIPSKYRNVSGTLVQIPKWGNVVLDCGEGTVGQITRRFGSVESEDILRSTRLIFISHIHADHHLGLLKLLAHRRHLQPAPEPVFLVGPWTAIQYLSEMNQLVDVGFSDDAFIQTINAADLVQPQVNALPQYLELLSTLGLEDLKTTNVQHRTLAFGIRINHEDGWSLVYSGDTMPCDALVKLGAEATVLIHEATMADDQAEMAAAKGHSTAGQAVEVGRRMNARNILLTHFSQRYPKMPDLQLPDQAPPNEAFETSDAKAPVVAAFDGASMRIGSLWKMEKYMDALSATFEERRASEGDEEEPDSAQGSSTTAGEQVQPQKGRQSPTKNKKSKQKA